MRNVNAQIRGNSELTLALVLVLVLVITRVDGRPYRMATCTVVGRPQSVAAVAVTERYLVEQRSSCPTWKVQLESPTKRTRRRLRRGKRGNSTAFGRKWFALERERVRALLDGTGWDGMLSVQESGLF